MTITSGLLAFLFGVIFIWSLARDLSFSEPKKGLQVGDVFSHSNAGSTDNPDMNPDPFVMIYTVEEIKDGKAKLHNHSVHLDGRTNDYFVWKPIDEVGRFDTKLSK